MNCCKGSDQSIFSGINYFEMDKREKSTIKAKPDKRCNPGAEDINFLVLHNDDHHTFEYVIECLIEVCGHNSVQAEQCTYLVHFKGRCEILKGSHEQLMPYYRTMTEKELTVTID